MSEIQLIKFLKTTYMCFISYDSLIYPMLSDELARRGVSVLQLRRRNCDGKKQKQWYLPSTQWLTSLGRKAAHINRFTNQPHLGEHLLLGQNHQ